MPPGFGTGRIMSIEAVSTKPLDIGGAPGDTFAVITLNIGVLVNIAVLCDPRTRRRP